MGEYDDLIAHATGSGGGEYDDLIAAAGSEYTPPAGMKPRVKFGAPGVVAPPPKPGILERISGTIRRGAGAVANVGQDLVSHPIDTLRNPAKRRQLERGIDDVVTLGYGQRIAAGLGHLLGDRPEEDLGATAESDAAEAPDYRVAGNVAGSFIPNPIAKAAGAGVNRVLRVPGARSIPAAAGMGAAKGVLAYEATAPVAAALHADSSGHRLDAAREAATDPVGLALSAGGGAVAGGGAHAVKNSEGGKARRYIEERGGRVGVTTPGEGEVFERMPVKGTSDADIGQQAQLSAENVRTGLDDYRRRVASDPYNEAIAAIPAEKSSQLVDASDVYHKLVEAYYHPGTAPDVAAKIKHQIDIMEERYRHADGSVLMTEDHLNGLRRTLGGLGQVGESTKGKLHPLQEAYGEAKRLVDQGPYAEANARYAAGTADADESLRLMDIKRSRTSQPPTADVTKIRLKGNRRGQNTVTAGADKPKVDRFVEKHPDLALELDKPELLRKKGDLSFSIASEHGGFTDRVRHAAMAAAAGGGLASGHGARGLLGAAALLAYQNKIPIAGRLLYPIAEGANPAGLGARAGTLVPRLSLPEALRRIRQQEERP